jgi:ABC-type nitrate/sulfonate/bicarbonate transport system permease component
MAGVRQIDSAFFEVARSYDVRGIKLFTRIIFPASLPQVLTGLRLSLNTGLLITVAVEIAQSNDGLGHLMWFAWQTMRTPDLYIGLFSTAVLGIGIHFVIHWISGALTSWQESDRQ